MADIDDIINTLIAEAGGQGEESMRRVAETIINRAAIRDQSFGDVVRAPYQYTGYSSPGPAAVQAQQSPQMQAAARRAWELALQPGDPTGGADHYYNPSIVNPGWQRSMRHMGDYGGHTFYSSRPVPPAALNNAVASVIDVAPPTRNVPRPRPRPMSPTDQANRLFAGTAANVGAARQPDLANSLGDYIARQNSQANLTRPQQIDRSVMAAGAGQDPLLAKALAAYAQPKSAPRMTTAQLRADNGQTGQNYISRQTRNSIADLFSMNGDPGTPAQGQTVATIRTAPVERMTTAQIRQDNGQRQSGGSTNVGKPPVTKVVQSVAVTPKPAAAKQTTAQIRADNGQARPMSARSVPPKMDGIGGPVAFGDIARMFGTQVPQARQSVNENKDQSRLKDTSVIGRADEEVLAQHGLAAPKPRTSNVPLPRPRPQQAPKSTKVAVTQPAAPRVVTGIGPTPVSQRPAAQVARMTTSDANPFAAPVSSTRYSAPRPAAAVARPKPLEVVVYANHVQPQQQFNPSNHSAAQMAAVAAGQSYYTGSDGGVQPTHSIGGKLRNTY